jgi:hypothetical protein
MSNEPTVSGEVVEKYHRRIWVAHVLLHELKKRGITDNDIRTHRLGEHKGRITIPIKNESGMFVNIRSYLPGAPGADKMKNLKGRAKQLRLFPVSQMSYPNIIICGGEMKAIVTARVMNKHNFGAVCVTGGEGAWEPYLTPLFLGKSVWVMLDIDAAGVVASNNVCKYLARTVSELYNVRLPLDIDTYPKGDINDYVADFEDKGNGNLLEVIKDTQLWQLEKSERYSDDETPVEVTLTQTGQASYTAVKVEFTATVSTLDTSPYVVPKEVVVECSRDQDCCSICPVFFNAPEHVYTVHPESAAILDMVGQRKFSQVSALKEEFQVPEMCKVCKFTPSTYWNVEDSRLCPQLAITNNSAERPLMPALCVGDSLELNETYRMTGRMHPHPLTQQSTLVVSKYSAVHDALSNYAIQDSHRLEVFKPSEWTLSAVKDKLNDVYNDLAANVTRIYQRTSLHAMIDLAYHSSLLIRLDDKSTKGWVEVLVVGDSAQGKSETALSMQSHYGLGEKVECKNASVAGLLGGLQQMGSRWFVSWGLWPTHDRRLLILEEVKGASTDVLGKLTDMRSSGFAEIPKIERRRTYARTRTVWLSNPRSNMSLDRYSYGVNAIVELIGSLEDVRRFDSVMLVEKSEVDSSLIHNYHLTGMSYEHKYTSQLCRDLILWCWTRPHAEFTDRARVMTMEAAQQLTQEFTDTIPIVDKGSMRYKVARLAAAVAGRTFSGTDSLEHVLVRQCHVEWVAEFLREIYSTTAMGYKAFTEAESANNVLSDPQEIIKRLGEVPYPADFIHSLTHASFIDSRDIMDWCQWPPEECNRLISFLVRKRAFKRVNRAYVKTPAFILLLKTHGSIVRDRPDYVEEF